MSCRYGDNDVDVAVTDDDTIDDDDIDNVDGDVDVADKSLPRLQPHALPSPRELPNYHRLVSSTCIDPYYKSNMHSINVLNIID